MSHRTGGRSQPGSRLNPREAACLEVVCRLAELIESSDRYTFGHCARVAAYAVDIARSLEFDDHEVTTVRIGAYLHDLGKVRVPAEILNKPGPLAAEESDLIREHPLWGVDLLAAIIAFALAMRSNVAGMNFWPPHPGLTASSRSMSISGSSGSIASSGVPGFSATPRTMPRAGSAAWVIAASAWRTRWMCVHDSWCTVIMSAPAAT